MRHAELCWERDRLRDGRTGGLWVLQCRLMMDLHRLQSQLVMGACELSEHDSVLKGHTEATHKQHGTWSQRVRADGPIVFMELICDLK